MTQARAEVSTGARAGTGARGLRRALALAATLATVCGHANAGEADVADVKVAFVYNFAKFTSWPGNGEGPVVFCVRQDALDEDAVAALDGRTLRGRPVQVRFFQAIPPEEACEVIYVSDPTSEAELRSLVEAGLGAPVLIVSDMPGFAEAGGHIEITERNGRMRFKINLAAAERSRLELSSKLLQLAEIVGDGQ